MVILQIASTVKIVMKHINKQLKDKPMNLMNPTMKEKYR